MTIWNIVRFLIIYSNELQGLLDMKERDIGSEIIDAIRPPVEYPQMELEGSVTIIGDIIEPIIPEEHWDSLAPVDTVS